MKKTMIWSILEMTIGFKRFKIMRSYARGRERGKEWLAFSNCFFRGTLAPRVRLALSSACSAFTSSYVKDIHGYCSFSLATSRYLTNRTTEAI